LLASDEQRILVVEAEAELRNSARWHEVGYEKYFRRTACSEGKPESCLLDSCWKTPSCPSEVWAVVILASGSAVWRKLTAALSLEVWTMIVISASASGSSAGRRLGVRPGLGLRVPSQLALPRSVED